MSSQFSALTAKLKEIFQINRPDLDFGVYRILNTRSDEIAEFLDKHLLLNEIAVGVWAEARRQAEESER